MPGSSDTGASARHCTKVAVIIGTLAVGGAELDIARNFPRLNREEFEVVVLAYEGAGVLAPELERQGIRVVPGNLGTPAVSNAWIARRFRTIGYLLRVVPWLGRTLKAEQADIAHLFLPNSYGYGMFACLLMHRRAKRVMSRLSLNFYSGEHRALSWFERNLFHQRIDIAIGNSQPILDELAEEGVYPAKLRLLHNGIDPAPFERHAGDRERAREALGIASGAFVMVAVGNLHAYKGHADLIEACALAAPRLPDEWRLLIAGRDQDGNQGVLEALAAERGLGDRVALVGVCEDVPQLLAAADVFAHPSHHEGLPNAIVEAMAASLPVVATSVGGIPEAVVARTSGAGSGEDTGWLVPPRDPQVLAAALLAAAESPEQRKAMGERGRARVVAEFSLERSVAAYEAVYRGLRS